MMTPLQQHFTEGKSFSPAGPGSNPGGVDNSFLVYNFLAA